MNNKFFILALSLMAQSAFSNTALSAATLPGMKPGAAASADTNVTGRYALPPSKVNIKTCRREALRLHPGVIEIQRMTHLHGDFLIRFQIQGDDGLEWFMLCDLATGTIIKTF